MYFSKDICLLGNTGTFLTYDENAMRLWSLNKQIKCIHHNKNDESNYKFLTLNPIDAMEVVLAFYTVKKTQSSDANAVGGLIRVYSHNLMVMQEVRIGIPNSF